MHRTSEVLQAQMDDLKAPEQPDEMDDALSAAKTNAATNASIMGYGHESRGQAVGGAMGRAVGIGEGSGGAVGGAVGKAMDGAAFSSRSFGGGFGNIKKAVAPARRSSGGSSSDAQLTNPASPPSPSKVASHGAPGYGPGHGLRVAIKTLTGRSLEVGGLNPGDSVMALKHRIDHLERIPPAQQRLLLGAEQLEDDRPLSSYRLLAEGSACLSLVVRSRESIEHHRRWSSSNLVAAVPPAVPPPAPPPQPAPPQAPPQALPQAPEATIREAWSEIRRDTTSAARSSPAAAKRLDTNSIDSVAFSALVMGRGIASSRDRVDTSDSVASETTLLTAAHGGSPAAGAAEARHNAHRPTSWFKTSSSLRHDPYRGATHREHLNPPRFYRVLSVAFVQVRLQPPPGRSL